MAWGDCSKTCGDGIQVRFRDKTPAANGGKECDGKPTDDRSCYDNFCPGKYIKVKYISISVKQKGPSPNKVKLFFCILLKIRFVYKLYCCTDSAHDAIVSFRYDG